MYTHIHAHTNADTYIRTRIHTYTHKHTHTHAYSWRACWRSSDPPPSAPPPPPARARPPSHPRSALAAPARPSPLSASPWTSASAPSDPTFRKNKMPSAAPALSADASRRACR